MRYKTIDDCLQNRFRKWTLDDLVEACANALYEYEGITQGVSKRTVQLDIQNMRSEKLGYSAPIIVTDKKFYSYEDRGYSITNTPLTQQDLGTLNEVVQVLKQFKGFGYFSEMTEMVKKLEDKIYKQQNKGKSFISFETNHLLKGLEHIEGLHRAIINQKSLLVNYQSFKARQASELIFYPYFLKEYRNRWFVIGSKKSTDAEAFLTLALDRMISFHVLEKEHYRRNTAINFDKFYDDVIGVTKSLNQEAVEVIFKIDRANSPYVSTKPLHSSQQLIKEENDGTIFSIKVIWNFELERELLGFGEQLEVLGPRQIRGRIKRRLQLTAEKYAAEKEKARVIETQVIREAARIS